MSTIKNKGNVMVKTLIATGAIATTIIVQYAVIVLLLGLR
jgi:hypothetical protein